MLFSVSGSGSAVVVVSLVIAHARQSRPSWRRSLPPAHRASDDGNSSMRLRRQRLAAMLGDHVLGVPVRPIGVVLAAGPLLVLAMCCRGASQRSCELSRRGERCVTGVQASRGAAPFISNRLPQRPERGSELGGEKLRLLPRREVTTLVDLVEVDQVTVGAPGPRLRNSIDLVRKHRDGHRERDLGGFLRRRTGNAPSAVLPVQPRRRRSAVRQPVQRDVVKHLVFRRRRVGITAVCPLPEAWMPEQPRRKAGR